MDGIIFLVVFWCIVGFMWHRYGRTREPPKVARYEPDSNLLLTLEKIDEIKITAERIRQLENILTDLDLIGNNSEKGITLTVPSVSGQQTEYRFISSQSDTGGFRTATKAELDRLKRTLQQQIDSLQQQQKRNESNSNSRKGE